MKDSNNAEGKNPDVTTTNTTATTTSSAETTPVSTGVSTETTAVTSIVSTETTSEAPETKAVADDTSSTVDEMAKSDVKAETLSPEEVAKRYRRQVITQYAIAFVIILVIAGGLLYVLEKQGRVHTGVIDKLQALESFVIPEKAALTVNGVKVPMSQYVKASAQLEAAAVGQQLDPKDEKVAAQIKDQTIDQLVTTEVLRQAAIAAGVNITSDQVEARYADIVKQVGGEDKLVERMNALNITPASLRVDIHDELLIQTNLDKAVSTSSITVTDEEVKKAYDTAVAAAPKGADIPPFAKVRDVVKSKVVATKQQELITQYIQDLKDKAKIETLI